MIAKPPGKKADQDAARFIGKADKKAGALQVNIRMDAELIERIDEAAELLGLKRNAFIVSSVVERLRTVGK